tara:strand:- start:1221 stop:1352 length:132 start_codon:yes stop_codon:yes gene_type:complete
MSRRINDDALMERGILLPFHHGMTDEMFQRLHDTADECIAEYS